MDLSVSSPGRRNCCVNTQRCCRTKLVLGLQLSLHRAEQASLMNKISRLVTNTVTLGTAGYLNPFTVTAQGTIAPGGIGVVVPANYTGATIVNYGGIDGGGGNGNYSQGNVAIYSASNLNLSNHGGIHGGNVNFVGSGGGNGVDVSGAAIVSNAGQISGGGGVYGIYGGGDGGSGIDIHGSLTLTNTGNIFGGYGGPSGHYYIGTGGVGVERSRKAACRPPWRAHS
jgi:hypothetical protein